MLDFYIPLGEIFKFGSINQVVHEIERFFQAIINETNTTWGNGGIYTAMMSS